jgi:hypothetical protein
MDTYIHGPFSLETAGTTTKQIQEGNPGPSGAGKPFFEKRMARRFFIGPLFSIW